MSGGDFFGDGEGRCARIGSLCNRSSYHEVIRTGFDCFRGRGYARLIVERGAGRAHAGNYDQEIRAARAADGLHFVGRSDNTVECRSLREASESESARGRRA
jgi:hypothetical protein